MLIFLIFQKIQLTRTVTHDRMHFVEMILSAALAQLVERRLGKAEVGGSNPLGSSPENRNTLRISFFLFARMRIFLRHPAVFGSERGNIA